jgi:phytoene dehydrogenase-like protein
MKTVYDALVVGGGHNALTTAGYLAKAGYKVAVFERRHVIGGAVCTEDDIFPGYKVDVGSGVHIMIHLTPVVRDLDLEAHGLKYLDMDPIAYHPLEGGGGFGLYRDLERTCESIATVSPKDAVAYRKFVKSWDGFADKLFNAFQKPPTPVNLISSFAGTKPPDMDLLRGVVQSYGHYLRSHFEHPAVRGALAWLAAQSGPAPHEIGAGGFLMWHAVLHRHGAKRAVGGSGALTRAMGRSIEANGGEVHLNAPVARIELEGGRAKRVVLEDGRVFEGRVVISGAHVQTTLLDLVGEANLPGNLPWKVQNLRVGNGFGLIHRVTADRLPQYAGAPESATNGMQLLCPDLDYLEAAFRDYDAGIPSRQPAALGMTFTGLDPSLAPPGKHLIYLWGQYYPFERSDGRVWDRDAELEEGAKLEEVLYRYAPNMRGALEQRFTQSPLDIQNRIGLRKGNVMHLEMSLDQMFTLRPLPELSGYRTPIPGLYLCGASTHPGGGVFAASGRSAALVAMHDLEGGFFGKTKKWLEGALGSRDLSRNL